MGGTALSSVGVIRGIARLVGDGDGTAAIAVGVDTIGGKVDGSVAEVVGIGAAVAAGEGAAVAAATGGVTVDAVSVPEVVASGSSNGLRHPTARTTTTIANKVKKYMRFINDILCMQPSIRHSSINRIQRRRTPDALC